MTFPWNPIDPEPVPVPKVPGWWATYAIVPESIPSAEAFGTPIVARMQLIYPSGIPSAEAFGHPTLVYHQFIGPTGIPSSEAFGGSAVNPGPINIGALSIATAEAFGTPAISVGATNISPTGIPSAEAFGTATITTGPVDVSPTGIASAEAFGTPKITQIVAPAGIASEETFGVPMVGYVIAPQGIPSAEAFGNPNVIGPPQAIQPTGIPSAEAFGGSVLNPGAVNIAAQGIPSAEAFGTPTILRGPVNLVPTGIPSAEAFGTAKVNQDIKPSGIVSQETFGVPKMGNVIAPTGIPSAEAFGTATVALGTSAFTTYIGDNYAAARSVSIPAHQIGDAILVFGAGVGGVIPTAPAAGGTVPTWTTIDSWANAGTAMKLVGCIATANNHTSGTWDTQCGALIVVVIRGVSQTAAIGGLARDYNTSGTSGTAPAITLVRSDGSSQIVYFWLCTGGTTWPSTPAGYTLRRGHSYSLGYPGVALVTKNSTTTDGSVTQGFGISGQWIAVSIEVKAY